MYRDLLFLFLAVLIHIVSLSVMPRFFDFQAPPPPAVIFFEPVERAVKASDTASNISPKSTPKPASKPKPAEEPAQAAPSSKAKPVSEKVADSLTETEHKGEEFNAGATVADKSETAIIDDDTDYYETESESLKTAKVLPPVIEEPDSKAQVSEKASASAGDRVLYDLSFAGKGRALASAPQDLGEFKASNNMTVTVSFKIDKSGIPYDIEIPPVPQDIGVMLYNFTRRLRFSAVLYNEPDKAQIKVTLKVRD